MINLAQRKPTGPTATRHGSVRARGFILGYVLFALLLLGIVAAVVGRMNSEQQNAEFIDRAQQTLRANLQVIRSQVLLCAVADNNDNTGLLAALPSSGDKPEGLLLSEVACPSATDPSAKLFDGTGTVFLPKPPAGFQPWYYLNQYDSKNSPSGAVLAYTSTTSPEGRAAANRLARNYGTDEVELQTASGGLKIVFYIRKAAS